MDPRRLHHAHVFAAWWECHRDRPVQANELSHAIKDLIDSQGRGRQFLASAVSRLSGSRSGGFVLTRQEPIGKWGTTTYALRREGEAGTKSAMPPMPPMTIDSADLN